MSAKMTKGQIFQARVDGISEILSSRISKENADNLAIQLVRGADGGSEYVWFDQWLNHRFQPQLVWLDENDYTRAITRALPQALKFAASDFGSTRQRDLGQLWTDTARGFMGELAFQKFLRERMDSIVELDISMDKPLVDYVATDIQSVLAVQGDQVYMRPSNMNVSIKTGKFNARWMDEYSARKTDMIDAFVFVRVGTVREHFIAFLKAISFLGTKLFPAAEALGELTKETSAILWDSIPEFEPVPAYISGFLMRSQLNLPVHHLHAQVKGIKKPQIIISQGVGNFSLDILRADSRITSIDPNGRLSIIIDGIQSEINDSPHFYANTGALTFGKDNWQQFVDAL